jgi:hypothetical protein
MACSVREANREEVQRLSDRLTVEVSTEMTSPSSNTSGLPVEALSLDYRCFLREPKRIGDGAEDLGGAAQTVGILHPGIVLAMRLRILAVFQHSAHQSRGLALACMGASVMDSRDQRRRRAPERLQTHRGGTQGRSPKHPAVMHHQA